MAGLLGSLFGGGGASGSTSGATPKAPSYSLPRLQQLYDRLSTFRESDLERPGGGEAVVETVRQITEALVWGEQNDKNFFDFFCEKSILADFIRVLSLSKAPKTVKVQLLQTLSMLVQNIRWQTSLYYLLSNNQVNKLILMRLDFNDEEILAYYITLLKSLAMRLDGETIKFFFIQHPEPNFPLYIESTRFFSHRDQMVCATVRAITLQVYPIEWQPMRAFVLRHATESYFNQLACHLRDLWLRLGAAAGGAAAGCPGGDAAALQHENDLQQDFLIYLSDVFELGIVELNEVLASQLLNCAILPLLLASVGREAPEQPAASSPTGAARPAEAPPVAVSPAAAPPARLLAPGVALFLARQVFDTFRSRVLLDPLATALLCPTVSPALARVLPAPEPPTGRSAAGGGVSGAGGPPVGPKFAGHLVPNAVRGPFVQLLRRSDDALLLFTVGIVHSCVRNRQALAAGFLESARIFPQAPPPAAVDLQQLDVLMLLLQALQRHNSLQAVTLQALIRVVLDLFLDPSCCCHSELRTSVLQAAQAATRSAAQRCRGFFPAAGDAGGGAGGGARAAAAEDPLLDLFFEEWESHRAPLASVAELCASAWRLLLPPAAAASSTGRGAGRRPSGPDAATAAAEAPAAEARQALRCFLLLRRLSADLVRFMPQALRERPLGLASHPAWAGPSDEASPAQVDAGSFGTFCLGMSFELGSVDRIVCGVTVADGKHTRYMLLHDFWLLLVQPDLSAPGWGVVTTLWPVQQVQSLVDRSDPRTLRVGMQAYGAGANPGEAAAFCPPMLAPGDGRERRNQFFTLALNFEDVRRCHAADVFLHQRRGEVRTQLLRKTLAFVEALYEFVPRRLSASAG